jgi:hypothetical protein
VLGLVWWPRLVVTTDGVTVRNVFAQTIAWRQLRKPRVESQKPYLGGVWAHLDRVAEARRGGPGIGRGGFPGLVLRSHVMSPVAVFAVQSSVLSAEGSGLPHRVADELQMARRAVSDKDDPVDAIRKCRRSRRPAWLRRGGRRA